MARIGLSKPYFAVYNNTGGTTTYSGGAAIGKAVDLVIGALFFIPLLLTIELGHIVEAGHI